MIESYSEILGKKVALRCPKCREDRIESSDGKEPKLKDKKKGVHAEGQVWRCMYCNKKWGQLVLLAFTVGMEVGKEMATVEFLGDVGIYPPKKP